MLNRYDNPNAQMSVKANTVLKVLKTGSGLTTLDILIRESIQNSLDAFDKEKSGSVEFLLDYITYKNAAVLKNALTILKQNNSGDDSLFDRICKRINQAEPAVLVLSDRGTTGLSGPVRRDDPDWNNKLIRKNFANLVYELGQNHGADLSGGSFGFGKSIYYNISDTGLVMYYSRTKKDERLAFCMISESELENNPDSTGISWWGETYNYNNILYASPITDPYKINSILEILNLDKIKISKNETGTSICIFNPRIKTEQGEEVKSNPIDVLKSAAIKWYWPRMTITPMVNDSGTIRPLKLRINDDIIEVPPRYNVLQKLLKKAETKNLRKPIEQEELVFVEDIKYNNTLLGTLAYKKIENYTQEDQYAINNRIAMIRAPRMVVYYREDINPFSDDYSLFGIFLVNSEYQVFKNDEDKSTNHKSILDNAFKESESATHSEWRAENITEKNKYFRAYVNKVQNDCKKILSDAFKKPDFETKAKLISSDLSFTLGKLLVSENLAFASSSFRNSVTSRQNNIRKKDPALVLNNQIFTSDSTVEVHLKFKNLIQGNYKISIKAKGGNSIMSYEKWNTDVGREFPFEITGIAQSESDIFKNISTENSSLSFYVDKPVSNNDIFIIKIKTIKKDSKMIFNITKLKEND